jgi:general stress protein 26
MRAARLDRQDAGRLLRSMRRISIAVLTTRAADGSLTSRPMLPLAIHARRELLFLTNWSSCKVAELADNPSVNVILVAGDQTRYFSVSGTASASGDRHEIAYLWNPTYRAWFPGGLADPDLALLRVAISRVRCWIVPRSRAVRLLGAVKALITGRRYEAGTYQEAILPASP